MSRYDVLKTQVFRRQQKVEKIELRSSPYKFQVRGSAPDVDSLCGLHQRGYEADVFSEVPGVGAVPECS